jgi:hypothetical protein
MTRDDDFIGQLEGYLDEYEGMTPLPDAVRNAVRAQLPNTKQTGPIAGLIRDLNMNNLSASVRYGLVAAVVVIAAIIGFRLISNANVGSDEPTPTSGPSHVSGVPYAEVGPLTAGSYAAHFEPPLTFTVPPGWSTGLSSARLELHPTAFENAGDSRQAILVCRRTQAVDAGGNVVTGVGTDSASLTAYVAGRTDLRDVTTPEAINIGGLDGWWLDFLGPDEQTHSTSVSVVGPGDCGLDAWPLQLTRLGVFDAPDGGNLLIVIYTPTGDQGFLDVGTPIVQSFVFGAP